MKKSLAGGVGVAAALAALLGSGTAGAVNEYKGLTYEKARANIESGGASIQIATRQGSYLPTDKCIISGSRRSLALDSSGRGSGYTVLVDLNCNAPTALDGHPGNSVATPEGKYILQRREIAKQMSQNYEQSIAAGKTPYCESAENATAFCVRVCNETGICSAELVEALGL